ncbi:hypothetical protein RB195_006278 [Necator americanus]|uniref:Uncharacterized protein n=1 Tax=Necator americanus TaxID=51031 RepID=A0ABR1BVF8_NECAM
MLHKSEKLILVFDKFGIKNYGRSDWAVDIVLIFVAGLQSQGVLKTVLLQDRHGTMEPSTCAESSRINDKRHSERTHKT